jgi:hypothetical protein
VIFAELSYANLRAEHQKRSTIVSEIAYALAGAGAGASPSGGAAAGTGTR